MIYDMMYDMIYRICQLQLG